MGSSSPVDIRAATTDDLEDILYGFRTYYWPHEALSCGHAIKTASPVEETFYMISPQKGYSLVATDPDRGNKVVGFLTIDILTPQTSEKIESFLKTHPQDKRLEAILGIFNKLNDNASFLEKYKVDKALLLVCVAVDPIMRGKSIGVRLFEKAFTMAKSHGCKVVAVDCSGYYSSQIAKQVGMDCIGEVSFKDYVNEKGEQVFNPPSIHTHIRRYIKIL